MPKISIIVPIYNTEEYLAKSISSLRNQTLSDIQIILVNDGSTDESYTICKEIAKNDNRIHLVDKPNGGVSSARNVGLELATGDYIGFVDPDDWIEPNMYENMYNMITKTDADVCMCNYLVERFGRRIPVLLPIEQTILHRHEVVHEIVANMLAGPTLGSPSVMGSVCRLLIRKELIEKNQVRFSHEVQYMEDLIFCVQTLLRSRTISIDHGLYYHYVFRSDSASYKYRVDMEIGVRQVFEMLEDILTEEAVYDELEGRMTLRYVNSCIELVANEAHFDNKKSFSERLEVIGSYCQDKRLKHILTSVSIKGFRKKLVLLALKHEWELLLYLYFRVRIRLIQSLGSVTMRR